jgi:hypothetical protein
MFIEIPKVLAKMKLESYSCLAIFKMLFLYQLYCFS